MKSYELPFATIHLLREDIAEVIVNNGIEMDRLMVEQYHDFLLSHLKAPFSLLVNKLNRYSYSVDAQSNIASLKEIHAMGIVSYSKVTSMATQSLAAFPRDEPWNLEIFGNREDALAWVTAQQDHLAT